MRREAWGAFVLALAFGLCSCGSTSHGSFGQESFPTATNTVAPTPAVGQGYLSVQSNAVYFAQWQVTASDLSGSLQEAFVSLEPPNQMVATDTVSLTGTIRGSTISMSFGPLGGSTPPEFGTITNDTFTLNVPQSDGSLAPVTFQAGPTSGYNSALTRLTAEVAAANQQAESVISQEQQQQAQQAAVTREQQAITGDGRSFQNALSTLGGADSALDGDVKAVGSELQGVGQELQQVQQDEQKAISEFQAQPTFYGLCYDVSLVSYDASLVAYNQSVVSYDLSPVTSDLGQAANALANVQSAYNQYQSDQSALPAFVPSGSPTSTQLQAAVASAQSASAGAVSTTNGYIDQVNADVTQAFAYASQASTTSHCGGASSPPTPLAHIGS